MFGRRRRQAPVDAPHPTSEYVAPAQVEPAAPAPEDAILAGLVARHLKGGVVEVGTARVTSPDLIVRCHVDNLSQLGQQWTAACFFDVSGGLLGPTPAFASVSGYGATPQEAVANGAHIWAGMVSELLEAVDGPEPSAEVDRYELVLDGRRILLVVTGVDRAFGNLEASDVAARLRELRAALGGTPWLLPGLVSDGRLPVLAGDDAVLLSLFVGETPGGRTVELKVHGADWARTGVLDTSVERLPGLDGALLRELALLVPLEPTAPLARAAVQRTLDGLAGRQDPRQAAGWQGWATHGGVLGPVLTEAELAAAEVSTGPLPDDLRDFMTRVAGPGAGPGYGLLPPRRLGHVVPLAHAGCGNAWVLLLDGPERGSVWMDAPGSDATTTLVAPSFTAWFTAWLDAVVRDRGPWQQYDVRACASVSVMSQMLTSASERAAAAGEPEPSSLEGHVGEGGLRLSGGGAYLPEGPLDPCHGCVALAASLGLPPTVFAPGSLTVGSH